ncbi:uncharacterized protein YpmB [Flavobacterium piscis]|uniref:Uncharacterized protein YpmB n=1 Tax=Flavobacterium piscis TaxID=1114874 RepID=A0ABU1YCR2_9FLAO|nr:uncharacterized protein YpmB [Flavobacterium piscis]
MKRVLIIIVAVSALILSIYVAFLYYVPYSQGFRSGEWGDTRFLL